MGRHSMADTTSAEVTAAETTPAPGPGGSTPDPAASTRNALELRGLRKTFRTGLFGRGRRVHALNGLDLTVPAGTVHALLGPNGAGKTTTVRAVATLMRPDEGSVLVDGVDAIADPGAARKIIGVSGQYAAVDGNLTGFENLRMVGQLYGLSRGEASARARELIADLALQDAADRPMRTYSGGMRRRLDLAGALINRPSLVILDEPTTGLDPRGRRQMWEVITEQVAGGATVLLTTQYLEEADALADEITVIDHGTIRAQGSAADLKAATGGSILTVEVDMRSGSSEPQDELVATTLAEIGLGMPERLEGETTAHPGSTGTRWSIPVDNGTRSAVEAVRALDAVGIDVVDATVATPTLDDVFLTLTERDAPGGDGGSDLGGGTSAGADAETTVIPRVSDADPDLSHAPTTRSDRLHAH
ncbi:ABC transporter ATP-binding protein [Gordonia lacunae]|uniref:ABC transporter ATP-binding protein n=1 Tax=Gordonia lacunae TaxID=417102 RepID=UPI000A375127|nr:ATP-binding cassette domain-containing protein [Gordonia lacunae]